MNSRKIVRSAFSLLSFVATDKCVATEIYLCLLFSNSIIANVVHGRKTLYNAFQMHLRRFPRRKWFLVLDRLFTR